VKTVGAIRNDGVSC